MARSTGNIIITKFTCFSRHKSNRNEATKQATPYKSKTKTLSRSTTTKQWCQLENEPLWLENEKPQLENEAYVKSEALLTHHQLQLNPEYKLTF